MRFAAAFVVVFLLLTAAVCANAAPTPKPSAKPAAKHNTMSKYQREELERMKMSAPADEYFGKMKLSYLGIDNTFRDQAVRAGDHTTDKSVTSPVMWAEDALRAWQTKYAHDPQLARTYYLAFLADRKIWLRDFQERAMGYLVLLRQKFPTTYFGKVAKADLAKGMTLTYYAQPVLCQPSPAATTLPVLAVNAKNNVKVNEVPVPCYTLAPSPTPGPSASPASRASPAPASTATKNP
jgi:hypothetical protein